MRLYLEPDFGRNPDTEGDGGIRRVVEAQQRHLPALGIELVDSPSAADVVACHIAPLEPTARFLEQRPQVPFIAHVHGLYWGEYEWPNWALKANASVMEAVRQADVITAPTEWVAQAIRRNSMRQVAVIGHGVDLDEWPETDPATPPYVLWNKNRVDPICDPYDLVRLVEKAQDVRFVTTYWPGDVLQPANVTVTGRLSYEQAKEMVRNAAVYLCTPRETFGIGTIEAMASGAIPLGWDWAGQREIVEHRRTGYLAKVGDFDDLAVGLEFCLKEHAALRGEARDAVEQRYQWKDAIARYASLYEALAAPKGLRPKVSVVIPAYDLEAFLPKALQSVEDQGFQDIECIVVDDASPDRCGEIAQQWADRDKRFKVIRNEKNEYLAGALNVGIEASRGEYVIPLDADNWLAPNALRTLVTALDSDRTIDIAYGNVLFVTEQETPDTSVEGDGAGHSGWPMVFKPEWQLTFGRNMIPSTAMYRRRVWTLTGGYRKRFKTAEDADFWTRATSYGFRAEMVTQADTLVYRNRVGSMSRVNEQMDWTTWFPWCHGGVSPAAVAVLPQVPVASCEPVTISVVIPVGPGHEELLIDALDSVDAQTFRLWEVVVVNDTGQPLKWVPSYVRVVDTGQMGAGVARARNVGIRAARGRLFVPLDADDTLEPEALARMHHVWDQFDGYVYGDNFEMNEGQPTKSWQAPDWDPWKLLDDGSLHAVTGLYPVEAWREVGGFDERCPAWEDWDFQLKLCNAGICGTRLPVEIFTYRQDKGMRREANYGGGPGQPGFEASKAGMLARWKEYFDRRLTLGGCSSCRGGGGHIAPPPQQDQAQQFTAPPEDGEYVLVEYVGLKMGMVLYRGPETGTRYGFDATATGKVKAVHVKDAPHFANMEEFRVRQPEQPAKV